MWYWTNRKAEGQVDKQAEQRERKNSRDHRVEKMTFDRKIWNTKLGEAWAGNLAFMLLLLPPLLLLLLLLHNFKQYCQIWQLAYRCVILSEKIRNANTRIKYSDLKEFIPFWFDKSIIIYILPSKVTVVLYSTMHLHDSVYTGILTHECTVLYCTEHISKTNEMRASVKKCSNLRDLVNFTIIMELKY